MAPLHQQLKDQHPQPKAVVLCRPRHSCKRPALQFRWRVFGLAHRAVKERTVRCPHLKGIGINQRHQRRGSNHHVALVYIADHVPSRVDGRHGCRQVSCCAVQVAPVKAGKGPRAQTRVEHAQQRNRVLNIGRKIADKLVASIVQQGLGPGNRRIPLCAGGVLGGTSDHPRDLGLDSGWRIKVKNLGHQIRLLGHTIHRRLSTPADLVT